MLIKICGITTPETAIACIEAGAGMIGLVHYPPSPRHIGVGQMREILDAVEPYLITGRDAVLVLVDQLPDEIDWRFNYIQPYGEIRHDLPIKRISVVKDYSTFIHIQESPVAAASELPLIALEMSQGLLPGGNGAAWNWSVARPFCERFTTIIAGGITPENVADVIRQANPYGIDVSSGVESAPGIKDMDKVKRLIENVHQIISKELNNENGTA